MPYARKVVLHCPRGYRMELEPLVEQFVRDGVKFVGVVGKDCATVEDHVDWIVLGEGSDGSRFILTSSHPDQSVTEALEFARSLTGEYEGEVQLVEL
jgi:hypothetical protein